ncbi:MAG: hypothetical protein SFY67_06375 [Candidatus Melainabacteria bacterium]|nr:hypothetical protein [Candidatus Melainabacteria bacterium]
MLIFWSTKNKVNRLCDGRRETHKCSACQKTATFYQCEVDKGVKLYGVVTLFGSQEKVMQCGECLSLFKDEEDEKLKRAESERLAKDEAKREAERQRIKDEEYKQREAEVDDELARLKKDLGK